MGSAISALSSQMAGQLSGVAANPAGSSEIFGLKQGMQTGSPTPFGDLLTEAVGQVNQLETQANQAVTGLISGSGVDVHQAMIATQKASMAFELTLSVRNKAIQAYQSVMGMQF